MKLARTRLETAEVAALSAAAADLRAATGAGGDPSSLVAAQTLAAGLPARLRDLMRRLRSADDATAGVVLSGIDLGELAAAPTPRALGAYERDRRSRLIDAVLFLVATAVGTPFCFGSQQQSRLVLDVVPLRGHETDQLGCSSATALDWHNEDAFHPQRADYNLLLCIRNDQAAATRLVAARELRLDAGAERQLRTAQFAIVPDVSHSYSYNLATSGVAAGSEAAFDRITELAGRIPRTAVLTGDPDDPRICVDFAYMPAELHGPAASGALATLRQALEESGTAVPLAPGDILIFDNKRCVHGRESFQARYDGTDRWMRRMNIARDSSAGAGGRPGGMSPRLG